MFSPKNWKKARMSTVTLFIQHCKERPRQCNKARKKVTLVGREK